MGLNVPSFFGDGSGLYNVSDIWETDAVGIHTTVNIGIGTLSAKAGVSMFVNGTVEIAGVSTFTNETQSTSSSNGAVVIKGGVGIGKDVYIRGKLEVAGIVQTNRGLIPDTDFGAFIGSATTAYTEAYVGNVRIGAASSNTIDTRLGGLAINASYGNLTQTASGSVSVTASGGNLTQTASGAVSVTASGGNLTQTASSAINQTATTGKVTIVASANDVEVNAGTGKSISLKKSTYITGDLEVRGPESVPPGVNSGTIRANYLEIPNITPVGGIVIWSGNENQLPELTVNGSVVTMWAVCDGRAISRTTYSSLFSLIGTKFGSGNGSSTFNLPDLRNRFLIGSSSDSGTSVEGSTTRTGGTKDAIVVSHNHGLSGDGSHVHGVTINNSGTLSMSGSTGDAGSHIHTASTGDAGSHAHSGSTATAGDHSHSGSTDGGGGHRHDPTRNDFAINSTSQGNYGSGRGQGLGPLGNRNIVEFAGSHSHGLTINGVSGHTHTVSVNSASGHTHGVTVNTASGHTHSVSTSGANHAHTGSVTGSGSHVHTVDTFGSSGTNQNLPPYYALYYIMRIL